VDRVVRSTRGAVIANPERRELRDDLKTELEARHAHLEGLGFELEDLREQIAATKAPKAELGDRKVEVGAPLAELRTKKPRPE
jgi:hypothetical protein